MTIKLKPTASFPLTPSFRKLEELKDDKSSSPSPSATHRQASKPSVLNNADVPNKRPRGRPRKHALPGTVIINGYCVPVASLEKPVSTASDALSTSSKAKAEETESVREAREREDPNSRRSKRAKLDVSYRE